MITLKNIVKTFNTKNGIVKAVDDVSLTIQDGEIFGVIGYSGAGKSTLIRILNQLEKQTSGEVWIDDKDISKLSKKELLKQRNSMGMIFQHFNLLWSRTVSKNIAFPLEIAGIDKETIQQRVKELISLVGLEGKENAYPSELSGGQKQRVGIARALANNPSILLCDEATSALDPDTTDSILNLLLEINKKLGITIVLITHQMEVVQKICHRIAVMVEGKVVEEGNVKQIFEHPNHDVTKRFVRSTDQKVSEEKLHINLKEIYQQGMVLRLTFEEEISRQPILSSIIKQTSLDISIVHANLTNTALSSFGVMYIHVTGDSDIEYQKLIQELQNKQVIVEVI